MEYTDTVYRYLIISSDGLDLWLVFFGFVYTFFFVNPLILDFIEVKYSFTILLLFNKY
jgi:hypothetical protein